MAETSVSSAIEQANPGFAQSTLPIAVAQTLFWAATFYLLPAMMLSLEKGTQWSKAELSGAMTASMIVSALLARPCGKIIDKGHGKLMMTGSGALAGMMLLICSFTDSLLVFYVCWLVIGACMAAILYEPCFSIITRHYGPNSRAVITHITLIAGFAGTIGYPTANWLAAAYDWRVAMQVFAGITLLVSTPLAFWGISNLETNLSPIVNDSKENPVPISGARRRFWLLTGAFTLGSINHTMVLTHLLALLDERGVATQMAVIAAMLIGPMQVVGRALLMTNQNRVSTRMGGFICLLGLSLATGLLTFAGANLVFIFVAMCLHGATWGLVSITRPTLVRETLGQAGFGATSGTVASIAIFGIALAPSLGAWLWWAGGYQLMLACGCALALSGSFLLWILVRDAGRV